MMDDLSMTFMKLSCPISHHHATPTLSRRAAERCSHTSVYLEHTETLLTTVEQALTT